MGPIRDPQSAYTHDGFLIFGIGLGAHLAREPGQEEAVRVPRQPGD